MTFSHFQYQMMQVIVVWFEWTNTIYYSIKKDTPSIQYWDQKNTETSYKNKFLTKKKKIQLRHCR